MFTKERIVRVLEGFTSDPEARAEKMVSAMQQEVHRFMKGAPQSDDLTLLAIRYNGGEDVAWSESVLLRNDVGQIGLLGDFVKSAADRAGMGKGPASQVRLAVEEVVVNAMEYAYPEGTEGTVSVEAACGGGRLTFVVSDGGTAFDPTAAPPPDISLPAEDRTPGGLGILLAKSLMDTVHYVRQDGKNRLTLTKNIKPKENGN